MAKIIDLDRLSRFKDKLDTELDKKANVNGNYPTMTVGVAEQLQNVSENTGSTQTDPFLLQGTGTNNNTTATPTAPIANHLELRGNSVAWNQLVQNGNFADSSGWVIPSSNQPYTSMSISSNKCTLTATANAENWYTQILRKTPVAFINTHKYLVIATVKSNASLNISVYNQTTRSQFQLTANTRKVISAKWTATSSDTQIQFAMGDTALSGDTLEIENVMLIDLSLLGKEYDDYVSFARDYPLPYYSFNIGELRNCSSQALETIGQNQFDGETEDGYINSSGGIGGTGSNEYVHSKNFIRVISGQTYTCFIDRDVRPWTYVSEYDGSKQFIKQSQINKGNSIILTNNTQYVKLNWQFEVIDVSTACFYLTWDGSITGFKPFEKHTYQLPILDEPLKSAGSVCDILKADGTLIRNIGVVDLGTLDWADSGSGYGGFYTIDLSSLIKVSTTNFIISSNKYQKGSGWGTQNNIWVSSTGAVGIADYDYSTAVNFKAAMSGVYLYYELATPTTTQDSTKAFNENIVVDDMGTMRFVPVDGATEPIIPQGNKFFYPADYVLFIDDMYNRSKDGGDDADANNFVVQSELTPYANQDTILQNAIGGVLRQCLCVKETLDFDNTAFVDLGSLTWVYFNATGKFYASLSGYKQVSYDALPKILCSKYMTESKASYDSNTNDKAITVSDVYSYIYIRDTSITTTDPATFKAAMKGVLLAYEKA